MPPKRMHGSGTVGQAVQVPGALSAMVVIQFGDRQLKGYTDRALWLTSGTESSELLSPPILLLGAKTAERISMRDAKAAFFVHTFEGLGHDPIHFHNHLAHAGRLWVRAVFHDGEVIEGMIENSKEFLVEESFVMVPNDPEGNNWLVFVYKQQLQAFHVLGLRSSHRVDA